MARKQGFVGPLLPPRVVPSLLGKARRQLIGRNRRMIASALHARWWATLGKLQARRVIGDRKRHSDLAIVGLAQPPAMLPRNTHRANALLSQSLYRRRSKPRYCLVLREPAGRVRALWQEPLRPARPPDQPDATAIDVLPRHERAPPMLQSATDRARSLRPRTHAMEATIFSKTRFTRLPFTLHRRCHSPLSRVRKIANLRVAQIRENRNSVELEPNLKLIDKFRLAWFSGFAKASGDF